MDEMLQDEIEKTNRQQEIQKSLNSPNSKKNNKTQTSIQKLPEKLKPAQDISQKNNLKKLSF